MFSWTLDALLFMPHMQSSQALCLLPQYPCGFTRHCIITVSFYVLVEFSTKLDRKIVFSAMQCMVDYLQSYFLPIYIHHELIINTDLNTNDNTEFLKKYYQLYHIQWETLPSVVPKVLSTEVPVSWAQPLTFAAPLLSYRNK